MKTVETEVGAILAGTISAITQRSIFNRLGGLAARPIQQLTAQDRLAIMAELESSVRLFARRNSAEQDSGKSRGNPPTRRLETLPVAIATSDRIPCARADSCAGATSFDTDEKTAVWGRASRTAVGGESENRGRFVPPVCYMYCLIEQLQDANAENLQKNLRRWFPAPTLAAEVLKFPPAFGAPL